MGKRPVTTRTPDCESSGFSKRARPHTARRIVEAPQHTHNGDTNTCGVVLQIAELLERVLSYLPPRNIFVVQRVSRHWKEVITASPEIQEMLFLRPRHTSKPLEIWEVVDVETGHKLIDVPDGKAPEQHVCPLHICDRKVQIRQTGHPREEASSDDGHRMRYLPVALNPLMGPGRPARRLLVASDGQGISCSTAGLAAEHISYRGTMALLEQYPAMLLTDPPTHIVEVIVIVHYRNADAPLTAAPVRAELSSLSVKSSTGVTFQDIFERVQRGKSDGCDISGLEEILADRNGRHQVFDGDSRAWDGDWDPTRQKIDLDELEGLVREIYGWERVVRDPIFQLEMFLEASEWEGLSPIIPRAEERRVVVKDYKDSGF